MGDKTICGISAVTKVTGMCRKEILAHIEAGKIKARRYGGLLEFEILEKDRLKSLSETYAGFFDFAQKHIDDDSGFSFKKRACRDELVEFAADNAWFGADILSSDEIFFASIGNEKYFMRKTDECLLAPYIQLWLASYGKSAQDKLRILLKKISDNYPVTGGLLSKFLSSEYPSDYNAGWILVDFLCSALSSEIIDANDEGIDSLAARVDKELPLNSARMFSAFLAYLRSKRKLDNGWAYQFGPRGGAQDNSAYPVDSFLRMAYIVFNRDAWEAGRLREKALSSEVYANLWLFVAFHFVCGWRGSDIVRIPMPTLPYSGKAIREHLSDGSFDCNSLLEEMELRLRYVPMKPNKTKDFNVPALKLEIAESLREPFGFIFSAAASYHDDTSPGDTFVRRAGCFVELQGFFGADFVSSCGNKGFSTRRANKSYLQGIEAAAGNAPGKPKGYMLAALARSHKNGYGALPQTTEIYLRDARFSGYSPEFIAREMFERGVFSFIPALLLDMYEDGHYEKLPVAEQTKLIAEVGVSPSGLEELTSTVQYALAKAHQAVSEIIARPQQMRESVESILQNIASGNATGRQDGFLCLMTAAGFGCTDTDRSCCIGCGYEIYTKTILRLLISECMRLSDKKKSANKTESARCKAILKKAVLPAISEILHSAERLYPDAELRPLLLEIERGLHNANI